jgi:hypothetical protein
MIPLLAFHLQPVCRDRVPHEFLEQLTSDWRTAAAHNLLLASETTRLLKLFAGAGIPAVPYKGPSLSLQLYGNVGLRPARDLDILIPPEHVAGATDLLESSGYRLWSRLESKHADKVLNWQCEHVFRSPAGTHVELHWRTAPRFASVPIDYERLWRRLRRVRLGDSEIAMLAPEDLLVILSVHGAKHLWNQLKWISDIGEFIARSPGLNWDEVLADAGANRARRLVLLGLWLTHTVLGHDLPRDVATAVGADTRVQALAREVVGRLFAETNTNGLIPLGDAIRFNVRARESLVDKVRYWAGMILFPTDGDIAAFKLPEALTFAYCVVRPIRMLTKHGPATVWHSVNS